MIYWLNLNRRPRWTQRSTNNFKMAKLPLLDDLIDFSGIKLINLNKIHNFPNNHDKIKIRAWKILFI